MPDSYKRTAMLLATSLSLLTNCGANDSASHRQQVQQIQGLEVWLDAAAEADRGVKNREKLAIWHDLSLAQRNVHQENSEFQPRLLEIAGVSGPAGWVVRFDGQDDCFRRLGTGLKLENCTLFVVAAPHANPGNYRGFFALNEPGKRDYQSGLNLDMNSSFSGLLQDLNVEGPGFGGARNLLKSPFQFGTLHTLEVTVSREAKQVWLSVDGQRQKAREFAPQTLSADEITVGGRYYENGAAPQRAQGHLQGDIAEVLLFSRVLSDEERKSVQSYLDAKYTQLKTALPLERKLAVGENVEILTPVENAPPIQMLVPGFEVTELPLDLNNMNNLRYRPDGKLYALGYDGDIWLLSDSNNDGLEETSTRFFENKSSLRGPIGMAVIPAKHALLKDGKPGVSQGVVVASKGKVSAILDMDGDDIAEEERVIAKGWEEIPQNVDAIGVAIHPDDGSVYFGLGTAAYNNAYLLDEQGKSRFDLNSERGTIQRIAGDLSARTTVCTGVRFTIGMEFNEDKELFVSEQEGATWLPNGNPFDELLHIRPGKHYGFPPRHPRHLPDVFDEPSTFDYAPQHQSTCGMCFNLPFQEGGPTFGPENWRGDLMMTGESRGKLYRTTLIRREDGEYVASNQLIGCLTMLTVDCCITPRGDLLVACHSGGPDWGTGPKGKGKIFRIRYAHSELPQPLLVWAAGPQEVRVAFDRPFQPEHLSNLASQCSISYGTYVAAGDRFETIRPGYAVTALQMSQPRFKLPVYGASVTPDRQTLILSTGRHVSAVQYALTLPGLGREQQEGDPFAQHPQIDLAYGLNGLNVTVKPEDQTSPGWSGWLPTLDLAVVRKLTRGIHEFAPLWAVIRQPGVIEYETQLDERGVFSPAVQPGSQLDYAPKEDNYLRDHMISWLRPRAKPGEAAVYTASLTSGFKSEIPTDETFGDIMTSWMAFIPNGEVRQGGLALHRYILPWAKPDLETTPTKREIPELAHANWGRGRKVFFSETAGCFKCHAVNQQGGQIGPDLSNLIHRDYASVLRDVTKPSFALNPDFITFTAALQDGRVLTGVVKNEGDTLVFGDKDSKVTKVHKDQVEELKPSTISIMPEDILKKLTEQQMKDLLAFLLKPAPLMPLDCPLPAPETRSYDEVAAVLAGSEVLEIKALKPLRILLVGGAKDHGPGEHDYPAWVKNWDELLSAAEGVRVDTAMEWPTAEQIEQADVIAFFQKGSWTPERASAIDAHLKLGKGLLYIHWAVEAGSAAPEFAQRIGLASNAPTIKYRHGPLDLGFDTGVGHPISRNFEKVHFYDESYWQLTGDPARVHVLGTGVEEGAEHPLFWTLEPLGGRVFVSIPGHYSWTFDDPLFRTLLLRGIAWSANEPVDRFNDLVTLGVTLRGPAINAKSSAKLP